MPTPDDYREARRIAVETLKERNIKRCCHNAGADLLQISATEQQVPISYLGRTHRLHVTKDNIAFEPGDTPLSLPDQVLLLHYLTEATGAPMESRLITFREVPSGPFYYPSFVKRAISPLVKTLAERPEALTHVARQLGRTETAPGDVALRVPSLPRVPVVLCLWEGDNEFPAEGNIYFDASISSYLGTEDIAYIAGATVYRVLEIAGKYRQTFGPA